MWNRLFVCLLMLCTYSIRAQIISTVAGIPGGSTAEGIMATSASIGFAGYIVFDKEDNYYFTSNLYKIRKVSSTGIITTVAGNGSFGYSGDGAAATNAKIGLPGGIVLDGSNNLYLGDINNNRIRKINLITGIITTIAGNGAAGFMGDGGPASAAILSQPWSLAFDSKKNLYFSDVGNYRIRKIDTNGIISTVAGIGVMASSGDGGPATAAAVEAMENIRFDVHGNLYIAQTNKIRKINTSTGIINTVAGTGVGGYSGDGGSATNATLRLAVDVMPDNNGNFYISEEYNHVIRKVDNMGIIRTVVGNAISGFTGDGGYAHAAQLNYPRGIALDSCSNLFILDAQNGRIRKVTFNPPPCTYLSIDEQNVKKEVSIYPNPANDELHIENAQPLTTYQLYNIVGALVLGGQINAGSNTITIKHLPSGLYMLALTDEDGKRTVHKIVKE